jgi:acetyltransferase-like isoleucine patch superfamily enzyme
MLRGFFSMLWFEIAMRLTGFLPEIRHTMYFRGLLIKCCLKSCGKNLQIARDVRIGGISNLSVGNDVFLSAGSWLLTNCDVTIEDEVMLGPYSVVIAGDHTRKNGSFRFGEAIRAPILLKRGCWIGAHSVVLKGVTVGEGSCLAAGSVATKNIPDNVIAGGVPAVVIKSITE